MATPSFSGVLAKPRILIRNFSAGKSLQKTFSSQAETIPNTKASEPSPGPGLEGSTSKPFFPPKARWIPTRPKLYPKDVPAASRSNNILDPHTMQSPGPRLELAKKLALTKLSPNHYIDLTHLNTEPDFKPTLSRPYSWIRKNPLTIEAVHWKPNSVRLPIVGRKIGMLHVWDHYGQFLPVSVVRVEKCFVIEYNHQLNKRGEIGVKLSSGTRKPKNFAKAQLIVYKKAGVFPGASVQTFRCTLDAVLPIGYQIKATHFVPGQFVDVSGYSLGRGFQGAMRRWNFGGQPATHGVSVVHRSHGSIGSAQDPGRVFKGKKMAGRWGNEKVTVFNLQVYKIDTVNDLLYIKGHIPSASGKWVVVRDAIKKRFDVRAPPPFPTFIQNKDKPLPKEIIMPHAEEDPFAYGQAV